MRPRPFAMSDDDRRRDPLLVGWAVGAVALLLWSILLPSHAAAEFRGGWHDVGDPGGASFLGALFIALFVVVIALPLDRRLRAALLGLGALLVIAFGLYHLHEDLLRMVYRNHPALRRVVVHDPVLLVLTLGMLLLPAGLIGRRTNRRALAPRILAVAGALLLVGAYFFVSPGGGHGSGAGALLSSVRAPDTLQGDRVAAWLALGPLVLAPAALLVFLPARRGAPLGALALVFLLLFVAAPLVLALHTAKPSRWLDALPAVKTVLLLGAGLFLTPVAVGQACARAPRDAHPPGLPGTPGAS